MPDSQVALLTCGEEQGTAFFLSPNLAVTARHCLLPHLIDTSVEIILQMGSGPKRKAIVATPEIPVDEDIVFLSLEEPVDDRLVLPVAATHLPSGTKWGCIGFPSALEGHPSSFKGTIGRTQLVEGSTWDVELLPDGPFLQDYSGLSGSPIVVAHRVVAIVQKQVHQTLVGISLSKLRKFLEEADIGFFAAESSESVPVWFLPHLESHVANSRASWMLEEAIDELESGVLVVQGLPGSGKSCLAATFASSASSLRILGRYFVGGDPSYPRLHFADPMVFATWLASQAALHSSNAVSADSGHGASTLIVENLSAFRSIARNAMRPAY